MLQGKPFPRLHAKAAETKAMVQLGKHMSLPYQGEDLMNRVKLLAQGSFRGTPPSSLGNKVLVKYLIGLVHVLSSC